MTGQLFAVCALPGCGNPALDGEPCTSCVAPSGGHVWVQQAVPGTAMDDSWAASYYAAQEKRRRELKAFARRASGRRNVGTCRQCGHVVEVFGRVLDLPGIVDLHHGDDGRMCNGSGEPPRGQLEEGDH